MNIAGHDVGVCSWCIPCQGMQDLCQKVKQLGLAHLQLGLGPELFLDDKRKHQELGALRASGLTLTAGMIGFPGEDYSSIGIIRKTGGFVPDEQWPLRKQLAIHAGKLAAELKLDKLTTHIGFIPHSNEDRYAAMIGRVREVAAPLAEVGVNLLMETGQEAAPELLQFLNDLGTKNVFVNFDPANMILYGAGDPIEAIGILGRHIRHVHVKDAILSEQPGTKWGEEVPFGKGQVNPGEFLHALKRVEYDGPLVIERELGENGAADVATAIESLRRAAETL
ncbi:MAG TPA: sugar phosphate isomerase/epimerase family protein [Tepidisphaeraceae bacterium]